MRLCYFFIVAFVNLFVRSAARPLKAVIVVGPQEDETGESIDEMKKVESYLSERGVDMRAFYGEEARWWDISAASEGAAFFIYC